MLQCNIRLEDVKKNDAKINPVIIMASSLFLIVTNFNIKYFSSKKFTSVATFIKGTTEAILSISNADTTIVMINKRKKSILRLLLTCKNISLNVLIIDKKLFCKKQFQILKLRLFSFVSI